MEGDQRMEELRGTVRERAEEIFDGPRKPAKLLLDDLNELCIVLVRIDSDISTHRYESYPESHHIEEEERR